MKTFKTLELGDKIFVDFYACFVRDLKYKNGYLELYLSKEKGLSPAFRATPLYYIPRNHLRSNKLKVGKVMIHLTKKGYKKYMNQFIKSQIEL